MASKNRHLEKFFDISTGASTPEDTRNTREFDDGYFPVFSSRGEFLGRIASGEFKEAE